MAHPLTKLLKNKIVFKWTAETQAAFEKLKAAMCMTPVLVLPDFAKQFVIETDACGTGVGAVLLQDSHPVAYYSKALRQRNQTLSIYEKEFLAILMAIDKWRQYLLRGPFIIKIDHKSLCHLEDQNLSSELQKKAMTKLIGLQYKFQYNKGLDNKPADALSRVGHFFATQSVSFATPVWVQEVLNSYAVDPDSQKLLQELAVVGTNEQGYVLENGLIKLNQSIYVGASAGLQTKIILAFHASAIGGHSGIQATYKRVHKLFHWKGLKQDVHNVVQ